MSSLVADACSSAVRRIVIVDSIDDAIVLSLSLSLSLCLCVSPARGRAVTERKETKKMIKKNTL